MLVFPMDRAWGLWHNYVESLLRADFDHEEMSLTATGNLLRMRHRDWVFNNLTKYPP